MSPPWLRLVLVVGAVALAALSSSAQEAVTVSSLAESAESYDGEVVRVAGVIADYRERVSAAGVSYTFFRLRDGRASVAVFAWPHLGLRDGQRVRAPSSRRSGRSRCGRM